MNEKLPPPQPTNLSPSISLTPIDTEGASTYHISASQLPLEFGGTLKSTKGSKNNSNQHSPQKKSRSGSSTSGSGTGNATNQSQCGYCTCFGCCGFGSRHRISMPFWPAVLANLGICALLVGYIFIGSFVFLTIENSNDRVVSSDSNAAVSLYAQHSAQIPQILQQQHQLQHNQQQKQQQQQFLASYNSQQRQSDNSGTNSTAIHIATNTRRKRTTKYLAKSTATSSTTPEVLSAHIKNMQPYKKMQHSTITVLSLTAGARGAALDYDLQQALPMVDKAVANTDEADYFNDDAAATAYEDATLEDVERRRTVENIWDITVSLNILYKENWTRLAALEIAKFQDQLVKRLVMDLTLSTANGATQSTATASRGQNGKQQHHQIDGVNVNDALGTAGLGNYERQRFWQSENAQRYNSQNWNNRRNNGGQRNKKETFQWNFPTAFLYSMTVITTVGYGTITPRTNLGRIVTIGYATLGIPLTLIYLSSIGSVLSKLLRYCCIRTRCGTCCCTKRSHRQSSIGSNSIFNRHQQVADRKTEIKLKHFQQPQQQQPLPYCYVRPPAEMEMQPHQQQLQQQQQQQQQQQHQHNISGGSAFDNSSIATSATETLRHATIADVLSWNLAAPIGLCILLLLAYITFGALVIALLEDWSLIDGIYFCFMSLSTIGFCDLLPGLSGGNRRSATTANIAIWFCAVYILSGLTLTSVCMNLLHDEIAARMRVVVKFEKVQNEQRESGYFIARS